MQDLIDQIKDTNGVSYNIIEVVNENDNNRVDHNLEIKISNEINTDELLATLKTIYDWEIKDDIKENATQEEKEKANEVKKPTVFLSLKGLNLDLLTEGLRYSMHRYDLKNPLMLLNIFNIIRVYKNLNKFWLENEDNYISDLELNTDLLQNLAEDIKELKTKTAFYFLSLLKSYNKMEYTPQDNCNELPNMFKAFFGVSDLLTISGIFRDANPIDTKDLLLIQNAFEYVSSLIENSSVGFTFMENFLNSIDKKETEDANSKKE